MPPPGSQRRAIIYGRVSALHPGSRSVDEQVSEGRRDCASKEAAVLAVYRDDGISASRHSKSKERPDWQAVMADLASPRMRPGDFLWVWEVSRASRDRVVSAALLAACVDAGLHICVGGKMHDPADPDDGFMLDLTLALAVRESSTTSKRVQRAVTARAEAGRPHGRVPYGYHRLYDERTGQPVEQVPDPDTGPVVREIVTRILAGDSLRAITIDLNDRGVPSPLSVIQRRTGRDDTREPWRPSQVRRIATSPTIAGVRVVRGQPVRSIEADWTPLVSAVDHARLLEIIDVRRERHAPRGDNQTRHLLTYLARCDVCDREVVARQNNKTPSYCCPLGHVGRSRAQLDEFVMWVVLGRLENEDVSDLISVGDGDPRDIREAREEAARLRAELEQVYTQVESGELSHRGLSAIEARLRPQIAEAEQRATPRAVPPALRDLLMSDRKRDRWQLTPVAGQREIIKAVMTIRIARTDRGRQRLDPASIIIEFRQP